MMNSLRPLLALAFLMTALPAAAAPVTEVTVIATMHGLHKTSTAYSYDALYALLKKINPDYTGVEIRPEDMNRDAGYLADNYPAEMIHAAKEWGPRAFGFDWLGDDLAGAPIAPDWWAKRSPIKELERDMNADTAFSTAAMTG